MRILIIFIFLLSNSIADERINIKNLVIYEEIKKLDGITFLDIKKNEINLTEYQGNLILLNFWATWCAPCKKEMPSLDLLKSHNELDNLEIFPINVGKENVEKASNFLRDLNIKNLKTYFDTKVTLVKKFQLRGIPTSILINKEGFEFARIIGSIDFENKEFIDWLSKYN